jgi:hypothetical protein
MQDNAFDFTTRIDISAFKPGTHTGLAMFEVNASGLEITVEGNKRRLTYFHLGRYQGTGDGLPGLELPGPEVTQPTLQLRVHIEADTAAYSYSLDNGKTFQPLGPATPIHFSWWKGSRPALFAYTTEATAAPIDFDWAHYTPTAENPW